MADNTNNVSQLVYVSSAFVDGLTQTQAAELREAFNLFDRNGDQQISREELGSVLRALGRNPTKEEVDSMMLECDTDESGYLSFEEYAQVISKHLTPLEEVKVGLREAFQVFDLDKSGHLDVGELHDVLCTVGDALTPREADLVFQAVDVNKDGKVDVEEFVEFLCYKV